MNTQMNKVFNVLMLRVTVNETVWVGDIFFSVTARASRWRFVIEIAAVKPTSRSAHTLFQSSPIQLSSRREDRQLRQVSITSHWISGRSGGEGNNRHLCSGGRGSGQHKLARHCQWRWCLQWKCHLPARKEKRRKRHELDKVGRPPKQEKKCSGSSGQKSKEHKKRREKRAEVEDQQVKDHLPLWLKSGAGSRW